MTSSDSASDRPRRPAWTPSETEPVPVVPDHRVHPAPIGSGNYGLIFIAQNIMDTWRAVKVVYRSRFESDRPYQREFNAVRQFEPVSRSHPSQLNLLQVGQDPAGRYFYYVMELADPVDADPVAPADGEPSAKPDSAPKSIPLDPATYRPRTLAYELDRQGRLPFAACMDIALGLATALEHLHRAGLVHRDVKPGNIVFVNGIPKLADIGLVTGAGAHTIIGTDGYMPPEGHGSPAADVFSLGRVLYEMFSGRDRFDFPQLPTGFEEFEEHDRLLELNEVVKTAGARNLEDRYPTAAALRKDLITVQAGGRSLARQRLIERALRIACIGIAVMAALAVGIWVVMKVMAERKARARELVREAQTIRLRPRWAGWSTNSLGHVRRAAQLDRDNDARVQAAAAFAGLDAWVYRRLDRLVGTAVTFDIPGTRMAFTGGPNWLGAYIPSRILDLAGNTLHVLEPDERGLVTFDRDGDVAMFSPSANGGLTLRAPGRAGVLRRFDLANDIAPSQLRARPYIVRSPDGAWVAAAAKGTNGLNPAVWHVADGRCIGTLDAPVNALAFSPDSTALADGRQDGLVTLYALPDLNPIVSLQPDRVPVLSLALAADPLVHAPDATGAPAWLVAIGTAGGTI